MKQIKAQSAGNGHSLVKDSNAGLPHLGLSLRASREMAIYCVAQLIKGSPFIALRALYLAISRLAEICNLFNTLH